MGTQHSCLPFPRFLKGLPVKPGLLSDELKAALGMDPTPGGIKYIIATQVRPGTSPQHQGLGPPRPSTPREVSMQYTGFMALDPVCPPGESR